MFGLERRKSSWHLGSYRYERGSSMLTHPESAAYHIRGEVQTILDQPNHYKTYHPGTSRAICSGSFIDDRNDAAKTTTEFTRVRSFFPPTANVLNTALTRLKPTLPDYLS